ncbi:zinc finger CCCH domain-containing protein 43 [Malania oleifera]|uniref:zinc finger CCCH domain-containing protein 43 n=1 Tax=Malania oleifera TaxID=397392 RepID=UPI0025AEC2E2|nr:zinc finger CCCH domain-containing protein 43 [Malania oleifera]
MEGLEEKTSPSNSPEEISSEFRSPKPDPELPSDSDPVAEISISTLPEELRSLAVKEEVKEEEEEKEEEEKDSGSGGNGGNLEVKEGEKEKDRESEQNGEDSENDAEKRDYKDENENENAGDESVAPKEREVEGARRGVPKFPVRPGAEDCSYYLRTGMCKFGLNCRFNHPPRKRSQAVKERMKEKEEFPQRPGQQDCKYYLRTGGCKYGKGCKYNHTRGKPALAAVLEFNFLGLPIRPGEKECPYYMRTGSCKYGSNCRFNHPDPTTGGGCDSPSSGSVSLQGASQSTIATWHSAGTLNETAPFMPVMFSPTPAPNPEWNGYQASIYSPEGNMHQTPAYVMTSSTVEKSVYTDQQMGGEEFPERPGKPECSYYLKTGDCKYKSACKYHHPKNRSQKSPPPCTFSDKGLPLRPDQNICTYYERYGLCKFGPACKFNHPINHSPSIPSAMSGPAQLPSFGNSASTDGHRMAGNGNRSEGLIQQPV